MTITKRKFPEYTHEVLLRKQSTHQGRTVRISMFTGTYTDCKIWKYKERGRYLQINQEPPDMVIDKLDKPVMERKGFYRSWR